MVFEFTQDGDVGYGWVWFLYVFINVYQVNHWVYHVYLTRPFKLSPPSHLELLRQFFIRQACIRAWKAWHESGSPNWMRSGDMDGHGWTSWCGSSVQALKKYLYSWLQRFFVATQALVLHPSQVVKHHDDLNEQEKSKFSEKISCSMNPRLNSQSVTLTHQLCILSCAPDPRFPA